MNRPDISEHALVRVSLGLGQGVAIEDFDPPLTEAEKWWYNTLKEEEEQFAREHPGVQPIWEIPCDYE